MIRLDGRVAVITGAARGIGRATVLQLASCGAKVVFNYHTSRAEAEELAARVTADGGACVAVQGDITQREDVERLIGTAVDQFGRVDILVNNAGLIRDGLLIRMSEEDWDAAINTNLRAAFLCTKLAARHMLRQRWGRIINVVSIAGLAGNAGQANYSAAKAGLVGFTKAVAREVASRNVTCNAVAPGYIDTDMIRHLGDSIKEGVLAQVPMGRMGTPEEVAPAIVFLASEEASYITGHVLTVDGGITTL
ncbi:MAG TPA: 3-oxoacyl-[acyl-carrier-protein] reductase [Dehalococcoidia bacterium]